MGLEEQPWWDELVAKKDSKSLRELAEEFGVSAGAISLALKKTGTSKVPQSTEPVEADVPVSRPGSKDFLLEPLFEDLGNIPDAEVAKRAGVSVRTVASYRARNKIPGYKGRAAPSKRRRRKSKIDPYTELLGKVPDRVVAEKAGVTLNAVRNYRANRGITSSRQRNKELRESQEDMDFYDDHVESTPTAAPVAAAPAPASAPAAPRPAASQGLTYAWSVQFAGERPAGVVVGTSAWDAAARASHSGEVVGIQRLGPMLA